MVKFLPLAVTATLALATALPLAAEPFRILVTSTEVPLVPNSVLHLAHSEGYFARAGAEVELIAVEQTPMAVTALRTGAGEMANISLETLLGLHAGQDHSLKAVGSTDKAIPYVIAARNGIGFDSLSEGARFGVGRPNSLDHTMSSLVLRQKNVKEAGVSWVPLGQPSVRAAALTQGRIDATTMSIGVFLTIPDRSELHLLADVDQYYAAAPILSKINAVPTSVLTERKQDVVAVMTALTLAARDYAQDPSLWVEAMTRARPDVARETLEALSQQYAKAWTVNGGLQRDEAGFAQTWLYQTDRFQNEAVVDLETWADFSVQDTMLEAIGPSEAGDKINR